MGQSRVYGFGSRRTGQKFCIEIISFKNSDVTTDKLLGMRPVALVLHRTDAIDPFPKCFTVCSVKV